MLDQGYLMRFHDREKAFDILEDAVEKSKKIGFKKGEIDGLFNIGAIYGMTGSYAKSLEYLNRCKELAINYKDFSKIFLIYNSFGIIYKNIGDYPTSQSYYLKGLKLVDSLQLDINTSLLYINLGVLYDLMDQENKAVESYEKAVEVHKGPNRENIQNSAMANLAVIDIENKDYRAALEKFLKIHIFYEKQKENIKLCTSHSNIGHCYIQLGEWELAYEHLMKCLELAQQLSINQQAATAYYNLSDLMFRQNKLKDAIEYSYKNLQALEDIGGYERKKEAHELAYKIHESANQLPKAIYHLKQTMAYGDSLLNETKIKEIQNLQIQHDVYLKDKEIKEGELQMALLNTKVSQNNKRLVYMTIIAALLLFSASLLYFLFLGKKRSNAALMDKNKLISHQNEVIESMNVQLEKRMLRAQMNPHFIFNSLNSIKHLINSNDKENALKYLSKFSKLLRQVLESSVNISLVLKEEIELLKIYVELEALRFDNSFNYSFNIDENLDLYQNEVPMLLVQPYIENAIVHGLISKEGPKQLKINFMDRNDHVECSIEDNGVGFNPKSNEGKEKRTSRGMSITEKRINALKKFSNQELIKIENLSNGKETGTRVTIIIPKDTQTGHEDKASA
ncbi:tetratricopeptide repeat-containing sensor histidine kinase [Flagellimonas baculiformis]|uniref:tetratricopeptide repeat-containing sensor histidine kinase n=1 Tax=Flagellimonas baculiformis TaxID=3067310 RepID=UPI00296ED165|nr:tetratricopeptide repeat protein [Muricauda sp. D6]